MYKNLYYDIQWYSLQMSHKKDHFGREKCNFLDVCSLQKSVHSVCCILAYLD